MPTTYAQQYRHTSTAALHKSLQYIQNAGRRAAIKRVLAARDPFVQLFRAAVAMSGLTLADVEHTARPYLDNSGQPCEHCDRPYNVINVQMYYRSLGTGQDVFVDGCVPCMVKLAAADADSGHPITLETVATA